MYKTTITTDEYTIWIFDGGHEFNQLDDNMDIEVRLPSGECYFATFFTVRNIQSIMKRYETSGEGDDGTYFWASDMVILHKLTPETIERTVKHLIQVDELQSAFSKGNEETDTDDTDLGA